MHQRYDARDARKAMSSKLACCKTLENLGLSLLEPGGAGGYGEPRDVTSLGLSIITRRDFSNNLLPSDETTREDMYKTHWQAN